MQEYLGLLIAAARRRIKQAALARAAEHALSAQQFWFLVRVAEHPGISQAELADDLRSDAPTVSRLVAAMARRRLVRTELDPSDRRRARIELTAPGRRIAAALAADAAAIRAAVVDGMTPNDVEALRRGLRRVIANIERLEGGPSARPSGTTRARRRRTA